jgi:16S rRNA (guanine527-N7)-methyltransferase
MKLNQHKILNLRDVDNSVFLPLCQAYESLVSYWNTIINVVSTGSVDNLLVDLIYESVLPLQTETIPASAKMLDVGSGSGIPAMPLKFARPDLQITLVEARRNKAAFLRRVIDDLDLKEITVYHGRLESISEQEDQTGNYDLITTRGTGSAIKLFPYMEILMKPQGSIWFYKGSKTVKEKKELSKYTVRPVRIQQLTTKLSLIVVDF